MASSNGSASVTPDAAQDRAARQGLLGDDHDSNLLIWNGALLTMPRTIDEKR